MTWQRFKISEFCKTGSGGTPNRGRAHDYYGGDIAWVKSGELREKEIFDTEETVTEKALKETAIRMVPKGALLIAMYGATVGRMAFLGKPATTNQAVCHVIPNHEKCNIRYLFYYLQSIIPQILDKRVGGGQPNISQQIIKDLEIPLPLLEEQKLIADILDKADAIRRKRQQAIKLADDFLRATFLDMFGDPTTNPKGWDLKPLKDLVIFRTGKLDSNAAVKGGQYPFFTCSRENFQIDIYAFDCEALLLAGNNAAAEYSVKYYKGKFNAYQRTYVISIKDNNLPYRYLQYALELKLQDLKRLSKGTNTKYLTLEILNNIMIQVPNKQTCILFDKFFEKIEYCRYKLCEFREISGNNFNSLTQHAFRGEL